MPSFLRVILPITSSCDVVFSIASVLSSFISGNFCISPAVLSPASSTSSPVVTSCCASFTVSSCICTSLTVSSCFAPLTASSCVCSASAFTETGTANIIDRHIKNAVSPAITFLSNFVIILFPSFILSKSVLFSLKVTASFQVSFYC